VGTVTGYDIAAVVAIGFVILVGLWALIWKGQHKP